MHTYIHTYIYIYTYTYIYICIYIYIYTHTYNHAHCVIAMYLAALMHSLYVTLFIWWSSSSPGVSSL